MEVFPVGTASLVNLGKPWSTDQVRTNRRKFMIEIDNYYLSKPEPLKSCLLSLRDTRTVRSRRPGNMGCRFFVFEKRCFATCGFRRKLLFPISESSKEEHFSSRANPGKQVKDEDIIDRSNERPTGRDNPYHS